jgi:hypothetical protein
VTARRRPPVTELHGRQVGSAKNLPGVQLGNNRTRCPGPAAAGRRRPPHEPATHPLWSREADRTPVPYAAHPLQWMCGAHTGCAVRTTLCRRAAASPSGPPSPQRRPPHEPATHPLWSREADRTPVP